MKKVLGSSESSLKERLREAFRWKSLKHLLVINVVFASVMTLTNMTGDILVLARRFGVHLLYCMLIGTGIYLAVSAVKLGTENRVIYHLQVSLLVVAGGLMGAMLASLIGHYFLDHPLMFRYPAWALVATTVSILILGFMGYGYFYLQETLSATAEKLAAVEVSEQKLIRTKTEAELDALRARVNPHFLFNTLNSIAGLIHANPDLAEELVWKLADLLRRAMSSGEQQWVTLEKELDLVRAYLIIEQARLGSRLSYEVNMEPAMAQEPMPVLLLQPLVENSVQHGIAPKREGGHLAINCRREEGFNHIELRDNGRGWDQATYRERFGLGGVRERLDLHYGDRYQLDITNQDGVLLNLRLPFTHNPAKETL